MFFPRSDGTAHFLALASATTAVVGLKFDDVKWVVSIAASMFGTAVALYIFRGNMRAHAELIARAEAAEQRHRHGFLVAKPDDLLAGNPPIEIDQKSGE